MIIIHLNGFSIQRRSDELSSVRICTVDTFIKKDKKQELGHSIAILLFITDSSCNKFNMWTAN